MRKDILNFDMCAEGAMSLIRPNVEWAPLNFIFVDTVFDIIQ
jgi:hypothetical protein